MRIRVFLDTSALFAGVWSADGGARVILRLGEVGAVRLVVSSQVLAELEDVLRRKAPDLMHQWALLLATCGAEVVAAASPEVVARCAAWVTHPGDVATIAAALAAKSDYFVTHDARHFLGNLSLQAQLSFPIGDPGAFLRWYRGRLDRALSAAE